MKLLSRIFPIKNVQGRKVIRIFGIKISLKDKLYQALYELENAKKVIDKMNKTKPMERLNSIEVHISEHCNLNCVRCNHFSPLAKEEFLDIKVFEKDIKRLSQLTKGDIFAIKLLGGEPLLNPDIIDYMRIARKYFPKSNIIIMSNGILFKNMKQEFFNKMQEYDIKMTFTKYPIKLDWKSIKKKLNENNIKYSFVGLDEEECIKKSWFYPLDLKGRQNARANFYNCYESGTCSFLRNGKIYPCPFPPNIHHFNKYFNKRVRLDKNDGIDIHKAKSFGDIADFLSKPIPFCRYCDVYSRKYDLDWGISKKEISEWVETDKK